MEKEIYMYSNFMSGDLKYKWEKEIINEAKSAGNLKDSLRLLADAISLHYPGVKLWFTEKLGNRQSYITGAGNEQYTLPRKYKLNNKYFVFLQVPDNISEKEENRLIKICRLLITDY